MGFELGQEKIAALDHHLSLFVVCTWEARTLVGNSRPRASFHSQLHSSRLRRMPSAAKRITRHQLFRILRRLLVLIGIFVYIVVSLQASTSSFAVLKGAQSPVMIYSSAKAQLVLDYVGTERVGDSKLVKRVLQGDTTPRNDTLYLNSPSETSVIGCSSAVAPKFDPLVYSNAFLRYGFRTLATTGAYNVTFLAEYELIVPIVDCTFLPLVEGDKSHARLFYLLRHNSQAEDDVAILTVSMAVQNWEIPVQYKEGSALVATFTLIQDMRVASVTHHFAISLGYPFDSMPTFEIYTFLGETSLGEWILESIPRDPQQEQIKVVRTAMRRGLFLRGATIQSNIKFLLPTISKDPASALSLWTWRGKTILRDSWAWVHYVHIIFAASTVFNQLVLFLVIYRNFQLGKIWIGDAFASVSKSLVIRGTVVLVSWHFNEYWTLAEICFAGSYDMAKLPQMFIYPEIAHADLLTLYLCAVNFLGYMSKTRIDPAFTILAFEIGFNARVQIGHYFPAITLDWFKAYAVDLHESGISPVGGILASLSPMRLWTSARVPKSNFMLIVASGFAIFFLTFGAAVCYVAYQKIDRRRRPERYNTHHQTKNSAETKLTSSPMSAAASDNDLTYKRTLTLFEVATGAELQNRFGVLSDYDNFVFFKGLKFASADGIYCNGFVIANGKFLIATEDIFTIILMKVLRSRLRNVYTYEVDGSKIKQTAQLVYSDTLTWNDLLHINVDILS